jgi:hypothetical protein
MAPNKSEQARERLRERAGAAGPPATTVLAGSIHSDAERTLKREQFLAWASEGGDPGGNALAGGPPVTREALHTAKRILESERLSDTRAFALAAHIDAPRVEYRIFSASPDPMGEERYPLALVHWDGTQLRFATRERIPTALARQQVSLGRVLRALRRQADAASPDRHVGLQAAFGVRGGDAGVTAWGAIRVGTTRDSDAHFLQLAEDLRLDAGAATPMFDRYDVSLALASLGDAVAPTLGQRIRTTNVVRGFDEFTSPLSWLGDAWVHTLPLVLHSSNVREAVREVAATLALAVPSSESLVVVYPEVRDPRVEEEFLRGIALLADHSSSTRPRVRSIALPWSDESLDTNALRDLITADIQSAA